MSETLCVGDFYNVTSDTTVKTGSGVMLGFFCNSTSAGTVAFKDGGASGIVVTGAITPEAANWYPLPIIFRKSLYVDVTGTIDITIIYK